MALLTHYLSVCCVGITKTGKKFKGHIEIPNLSDENDMDDLDVSFDLKG